MSSQEDMGRLNKTSYLRTFTTFTIFQQSFKWEIALPQVLKCFSITMDAFGIVAW